MSIETSAKAGHNVKALFKKIAMALPGGAEAKDATANQSAFLYAFGGIELTWQRSMLVRRERNRLRLLDVLVDLGSGIVCILLCNDVERLAFTRFNDYRAIPTLIPG
jgi:hypothetical protein